MNQPSVPLAFTDADLLQLHERGIAPEEAARQIRLLAAPPAYMPLDRPATPGDGIRRLRPAEISEALAAADAARQAGRCSRFIPASGAASRMFKELLAWRAHSSGATRAEIARRAADGDRDAATVRTLLDGLERFAFADALAARAAAPGESDAAGPLLDALLGDDGLAYASLPKGLLQFHRAPGGGVRTAFVEQLEEAAATVRDAGGAARAHFTVSPEHAGGFAAALAAAAPAFAARGVRLDISFSTQKPSTDTLALDSDGQPFRDDAGRLLFRPAGHGALIDNLGELGGDLVQIKNIDNIVPDGRRAATLEWTAALTGLAALVQERTGAAQHALRAAPGEASLGSAAAFLRDAFGLTGPAGTPAERAAFVEQALARPLRVCGMVANTGEPGGGPFWVREADGSVSLQIVESAQVDPRDPAAQAILRGATHFNPVFLVCALRDAAGRPYDLARFVDPNAVIVTEKSAGGRALRALERPGLWNGAMARWNTIFVEVPLAVFNPVKTVLDLLRPEHQAG